MVEEKDVPEEFSIEEREYKSVFKMFERGTPGEIHISTVFEYINKFEAPPAKQESVKTLKQTEAPATIRAGGVKGAAQQKTQGPQVAQQAMAKLASTNQSASPTTKKASNTTAAGQASTFGQAGLVLKPTAIDPRKL